MNKLLLALLCFSFSLSSYARELLPEEKIAVESVIRETMKDPDAAKFYHGDFPETDENILYCGLVNGKNSYGAYTGKKLFSVMVIKNDKGEYHAMDFTDGGATSQDIISATCSGAGYDMKIKSYLVKSVNDARKSKGLPPVDKSLIYK